MNKSLQQVVILIFILIFLSACGNRDSTDQHETIQTSVEPISTTIDIEDGVEIWGDEFQSATLEATESQDVDETKSIMETTEPVDTKETIPAIEETSPSMPETEICEFIWYMSLSPEEQQDFYNTFESPESFFAWYNNAKLEYDEAQNEGKLDNPSVDLDDFTP